MVAFILVSLLVIMVLATLEGLVLEMFLEVDYKKYSLFYKHIVKRIYKIDEED